MAAEGVLITGVYGTGKSSLAAQIADLLEARGVPYGAIDLDWLAWFDVGTDGDARRDVYVRNVRAVVGNEVAAGPRRIVLAGSVQDVADVEDRDPVGDVEARSAARSLRSRRTVGHAGDGVAP